jgi:hypothetical protein
MSTGEVYTWPEGAVYLWTGTTGNSALIAYATDTQIREVHGFINFPTLTGTYHDVITGRRADVGIGALYLADSLVLQQFASAETAVHMHLAHTANGASAGRFLWSGRIDSYENAGRQGALFTVRLNYHANIWSAY